MRWRGVGAGADGAADIRSFENAIGRGELRWRHQHHDAPRAKRGHSAGAIANANPALAKASNVSRIDLASSCGDHRGGSPGKCRNITPPRVIRRRGASRMSPHVSTNDLRHATLENAPGPQARINRLALPALRSASSGGPSQRQVRRAVSTDGRARGSVSGLSRRRACVSARTRQTRLAAVRPWSDLKFRDREFQCGNAWTGLNIPPLHTPDREFVPGVVCRR